MSKTLTFLLLIILFINCFLVEPPIQPITFAQEPTESPSPNIQLSKNIFWLDFPESIDFELVATATNPIQTATIEYGLEALSCGEINKRTSPTFEPDTSLNLTWRWQPQQIIPPGSTFWWRWHLTTSKGEEFTTPTQTAVFKDDWFVWESLTEDPFTIYWYRGSEDLARDMLTAANQTLSNLENNTGLHIQDPIAIYLYDEPFDLRISIPGAPAWIGGIAFPEHNITLAVVNQNYVDYGRATVRHELGHVVIGRLTFNCLTNLPTWLNEGLAMVAEGEEDITTAEKLAQAIENNKLLSIQQLEGSFSVHSDRASLSYAQSYSMVKFLVDEYGQEKMLTLLNTFKQGTTPDDALNNTYGFDSNGMENAWRTHIGTSPDITNRSTNSTATPIPTLALFSVATNTDIVPNTRIVPNTPLPTATSIATLTPPPPTHTPQPLPTVTFTPPSSPTASTTPTISQTSNVNWFTYDSVGFVFLSLTVIIIVRQLNRRKNS